jgi:hypothetical protein
VIEITLALDWWLLVAVLVGLFAAAWGYNAWVDSLKEKHEGGTAWLVVRGVGFTLVGAALLIGIVQALIVAACFIASGVPMIYGERKRNERRQKEDAEENKRLDLEYIQRMKDLQR